MAGKYYLFRSLKGSLNTPSRFAIQICYVVGKNRYTFPADLVHCTWSWGWFGATEGEAFILNMSVSQ